MSGNMDYHTIMAASKSSMNIGILPSGVDRAVSMQSFHTASFMANAQDLAVINRAMVSIIYLHGQLTTSIS